VSQGLIEEAVGIYERLLARDPYNARLAAALEDVRARGKGQVTTRTPAKPARPDPPPLPRPEPAASPQPEAAGPPVREFLRALLEGRAPMEQGADAPIDWPEWLRNLGSRR
jgi:hypothetical protein